MATYLSFLFYLQHLSDWAIQKGVLIQIVSLTSSSVSQDCIEPKISLYNRMQWLVYQPQRQRGTSEASSVFSSSSRSHASSPFTNCTHQMLSTSCWWRSKKKLTFTNPEWCLRYVELRHTFNLCEFDGAITAKSKPHVFVLMFRLVHDKNFLSSLCSQWKSYLIG